MNVTNQEPDGFAEAAELFRALASPVRIALVVELAAEERCVHELVETLDLPNLW